MDTKVYFEKWSEKLSIPVEDIQSEYDGLVANEKEIHSKLTEEEQQTHALKRLALIYKKQLRSPAIGFEGMIIGVGDIFDTARKMRQAGMDAFRENPHQAIEQGITNVEGNPLDTREVFGTGRENSSFGKLLPEHSYIRNIVGVALRANVQESPKLFSMTLNGDKAENCDAPMFQPVKFRAINKSEENADTFTLNGSSVTRFDVSDKIEMPAPIDVLRNVCKDLFVPLSEVEPYHKANKDDFNRLGLFEGDVSMIGAEPTATGSTMMVIEDMNASIEDLGIPGMTCWVPKNINFDFAEGSKVITVGRTGQGKSRDNPEELGDVMLNVLGIYAIPEFRIEPEVLEVNAEMAPEEITKIEGKEESFVDAPEFGKAPTESQIEAQTTTPEPKEEIQTDLNTGW